MQVGVLRVIETAIDRKPDFARTTHLKRLPSKRCTGTVGYVLLCCPFIYT